MILDLNTSKLHVLYATYATNKYKDGKKIIQFIRSMHMEGKLNDIHARPFAVRRPPEELYDLKNDPFELVNLAENPINQKKLLLLRNVLIQKMIETRDVGLIPEPILEDIGLESGNKYNLFSIKIEVNRLVACLI